MINNMKDLFISELYDVFNCEEQNIEFFPDVIRAVNSDSLREALKTHLKETKEQVKRLDKIFSLLAVERKSKECQAAKGLIMECSEVLEEFNKSPLLDAALISKLQRMEHYEMATYGTLRTWAKELDLDEVADLLQNTLDEEGHANKKLMELAKGGFIRSGINHLAHKEAA